MNGATGRWFDAGSGGGACGWCSAIDGRAPDQAAWIAPGGGPPNLASLRILD
ncbi:MAG TPA: hypothetical protein VHK01_13155 [Lacipirellulaceae bacterium]|jgi:hypothetical protein|nr:hypothetical protein [Lacipirellulaceae bacterium]